MNARLELQKLSLPPQNQMQRPHLLPCRAVLILARLAQEPIAHELLKLFEMSY